MGRMKLLDRIRTPHQLRRLSQEELVVLAEELRARIVEVVSRNGGHLASNLGIAELTIAMHYVFDFSKDRLLWDVGHQCYAHKIITGRNDQFGELRKAGGTSGFPNPRESEYDLFATGHAGTAISTAMGMAWADKAAGVDSRVVAVVGDASITNGLAMEGLNNAAMLDRQFLIVLNDNSMAIDKTAGAMSKALDRVRMTHTYRDMRQSAEELLQHLPLGAEIGDALRNIKTGLKATIHGGRIFETLGFTYFQPVDGHDIGELIKVFKALSGLKHPAVLHVKTQKGRGCSYAVEDPCRFHSPSAYTEENGHAVFAEKARSTWTQTFSEALVKLGREDERIVAITAAMPDGTGLCEFREQFPDRYVDVGISESHAVAMAAGLAKAGLRPVVAVYSTFMQRAMDQIFQEASLQSLPILLCMDRAGLVGSDGPVHHGFMDIACLRAIPQVTLMAPADASEMLQALRFGLSLDSPSAIRYPRDEVPADLPGECPAFELGKARVIGEGQHGTFLCYGTTLEPAMAAAEILRREFQFEVGIVNARFAKPLDAALIARLINSGRPVVTAEDHAVSGGFGSAVLEMAAERGLDTSNVRLLGLPDRYIAHASRLEQLVEVGLDATNMVAVMKELILNPNGHPARHIR